MRIPLPSREAVAAAIFRYRYPRAAAHVDDVDLSQFKLGEPIGITDEAALDLGAI